MCWPGEKPRNTQLLFGWEAVRSCPGAQRVGALARPRGGECELGLPQAHGDDVVGNGDVVPGELDDVFDVLAEYDDQDRCSPISHGELVGVHHALDGCVLLGLGQPRAGAAAMARDGELGVNEPALDRPWDEAVDKSTGAWPIGQPGVEVFLSEPVEGDAVIVSQLRNSIATVTVCFDRRKVPCDTVSIWFIRR